MTHISELDFWQWAYSDHLSNANRGVLAEYIVGCALGALGRPRVEWDAYDLLTPVGVKVEVKSSAYLQSWKQRKPSTIVFDIGLKTWWDEKTSSYATEPQRASDVYVFCLFKEQDPQKANPLDLTQWCFMVCTARNLDEWFGNQKSVRLAVLKEKILSSVSYEQIAEAVESVVATQPHFR